QTTGSQNGYIGRASLLERILYENGSGFRRAYGRASRARVDRGSCYRSNVFVDKGVRIGDRVRIQNNVSVYAGVTLDDDVFVGPSAVFTNDRHPRSLGSAWELSATLVRRGASIGANATIVSPIEIGNWAMVGAGAVVTQNVRAHQLVIGN